MSKIDEERRKTDPNYNPERDEMMGVNIRTRLGQYTSEEAAILAKADRIRKREKMERRLTNISRVVGLRLSVDMIEVLTKNFEEKGHKSLVAGIRCLIDEYIEKENLNNKIYEVRNERLNDSYKENLTLFEEEEKK